MLLSRLIAFRSIRFRFRRFVLSLFGIIVGVATLLAINVTNQTSMASIVQLFSDTSGKTKLSVVSAYSESEGFDEVIIGRIANNRDVSFVSPIIKEFSDLAGSGEESSLDLGLFGLGTGGILIQGVNPENETHFREYSLAQGSFLTANEGKDQIVLGNAFAEENEIETGDWIDIVTPFGSQSLEVAGILTKEGPGQINNGQLGIMQLKEVQELFDRKGEIDQIDVLTTDPNISRAELNALKDALQTRLGKQFSVIFPASQGSRMTEMLQGYQIGLSLLSGMALFVGAFIIYNSFAMTVLERTREFGMLRTIGMTSLQITLQVLIEAGLLGVIGSGLGLGLGFLLSKGLTRIMEIILGQSLSQVDFPSELLLASFLVGIAVTVFSALTPAWQAGKISPLEALRVRSKSKESWVIKKGWLIGCVLTILSLVFLIANPFPNNPNFSFGGIFGLLGGLTLLIPSIVKILEPASRPLIKLLYGSSGGLGSRNIQRSRLRTTLTVAALLVSVSMVITTKVITSSFSNDIRSWMDGYIGGDMYITSATPLKSYLADQMEELEGVSAVVPIRYINVDWQTPVGDLESVSLMGFDPVDYVKVTDIVFSDEETDTVKVIREMVNDDAILISSVLAELYNLSENDMITIRTRIGYQQFPIAGIIVDFNNQGKVIQCSWNTMRRFFRVNDASMFFVKAVDSNQTKQTSQMIEKVFGKRYDLSIIVNEDIRSQAFTLMDQAFSMFEVTSLIAIVVGSLGIINTLTISVIERTREIGMLRAIAMTHPQVFIMILAEASLIGFIGGLFGLVSGLLLSRIVLLSMKAMAGYSLAFSIQGQWLLITFIATFLISQIAALLPAKRAVKIAILDALRYE